MKDERTSTLSICGSGSSPFLAKSGPRYGPNLAEIGSGFVKDPVSKYKVLQEF